MRDRRAGRTRTLLAAVLLSLIFAGAAPAARPDRANLSEDQRAELARADSLGAAMEAFWDDGAIADATEAARARLDIYRAVLGSESVETAAAEDDLATLLQDDGLYDDAEPLFRDALAVRRRLLGDEAPDVGASLNNLGMLLQYRGDYAGAESYIRQALGVLEAAFGEDDLDVAAIRSNLGMLLQYRGDFDGAEQAYLKSLAVRREKLGDDAPDVASSLNNLATLYYQETDYAKAEPFLREATAIWRSVLGDESPDVALSLNNMGALLTAQGDYAGAEPFQREAVAIYRRALGDEHPDLAYALHNLAHTLESEGDYAGAEPLFREALSIRRAAYGDAHPDIAVSLNGLAHVLQAEGRFDEAEPLYREALAMRRELLGDDHIEVATDLSNLASLLVDEKRYEEAEPLYERALAIRRSALGEWNAAVAHNLSSIGHLKLAEDDPGAAERVLAEAVEVNDAARLLAGEGLKRATIALRLNPPASALAIARLHDGNEIGAWPAAEKALGRALADLLMSSEERSLSSEEAAREDSLAAELGRLEQDLSVLTGAARSDTTGEAAAAAGETRTALLQAEAAWSAFRREMAGEHPVTEGASYSLERVQRALPADAAILGWVDIEIAPGRPEAWAYVVRSSGPVAWGACPLSGGSPARRTARFRDELADPRSSRAGAAREARGLWSKRVAPVAQALDGITRLVVIPSGAMLGVPVETLIDGDGTLLRDRFAISYSPSATIYAWLEERGIAAAGGRRMLLLGDPPYSESQLVEMEGGAPGASTGGASRGAGVERTSVEGLPRLPGSRDEVTTLATLASDPTLLLGPNASEQRLDSLAESDSLGAYDVIHLATHAVVDDERPERSALVLSQAGLPDPVEAAMAGTPIYDGLLTAGEIVRGWKLNCDLVTLSACETGLGKEIVGEGYIGFAHAFLQAGARSLLVSLWKVEDRATSLLMKRFYEDRFGAYGDERGAAAGTPMTKAEALREAKSWLASWEDADGTRPYEHPYYWSAFILVGDRG
jgi:CHAT domain-containing protein/tetratricopeptide (TPR) repeat protein